MVRPARRRVALFLAGVAVLLVAGTFALRHRQSGPGASYTVRFDREEPGAPRVLATFSSFEGTLVIDGYLQHAATGFAIDSIFTSGDSPLAYRHETFSKSESVHAQPFDRVRVEHTPAAGVHVAYRLDVGNAEGNPHTMGLAGARYGLATRDWVVTSLAQLLVVPSPPEAIRRATVHYELPDGWAAVGAHGGEAFPRRLGKGTFADLFFAPLAIGRLKTFTFHDLNLRVAVADETDARAQALADRVRRLYREIAGAFHVVPSDPYFVVLTPPDADGFTVHVEPTYFGDATSYQGNVILRTDDLSRHMIQRIARAAHADSAFAGGKDRWFLPSLFDHVAARASRTIENRPMNPLDTTPLDDYLQMIEEAGDITLASPLERGDSPRVKGRAVTETLDAFLRKQSGGRDSLEAVLPFLSDATAGATLAAFLEQHFSCDLDSFFADYVYGTTPLPYPSIPHAVATRAGAAESAVRDSVALVVAYDGHAYLETCGCKANMWGGVARLATWTRDFLREFRGPVFMLSAGNAFPMDRANVVLDSLATGELQLYLSLIGGIGFKTAVVGQSELFHGTAMLERMAREGPIAFVSANVAPDEVKGVAPYRLEANAGCTLGVTGLVAREDHPLYDRVWEARTAGITFEPAVPAAGRAIDAMRAEGADLVVVAGKIKPAVIRDIARIARSPSVIVSYRPICKCVSADGRLYLNDESGSVGDDLVLYPKAGRYGVSLYVLYRDASGRVLDFREQQVYMKEAIADDPKTRRAIDDFYLSKPAAVSPALLAANGYWADSVDRGARYVGAPVCRTCHGEQYDQWIGTSHGSAFKTLLGQHRQYNPTCVSCHVTGFGQESGYAFGDMRSPLMHVQCEACHGPGAVHVAANGDGAILRTPTNQLCMTCHATDHSDMTNENFPAYYAKVVH